MTTYPNNLNFNEENVGIVDYSLYAKETVKLPSGSSLSWWMYLIIVIVIFVVAIFAHYIVKKINGARLEERFVRLNGKISVTTQVSKTLQNDDLKNKLELKLDKEGKVIQNPREISLIFSKEQNKGRTSLITSWPTGEKWKNICYTNLKLCNSSETQQKKSISDNMNNNSSTHSTSQNNSTLDLDAKNFHNLSLENPGNITVNEKNDKGNPLVRDDLENIYTNENQGTLTTNGVTTFKKIFGANYCSTTSEDSATYTKITNPNNNGTHLTSFERYQFCDKRESDKDSAEKLIEKPVSLLIANKVMTKNDSEVPKTVEKNIYFKPPVTIIIPDRGISENTQKIETVSENDASTKITINAEGPGNNETKEVSESKILHDASRSKESIKKSVSRVTFKHETMIPNVDDLRCSEASRSRTESLKSNGTHSKESILKSSATHSKESIKKQSSKVTFVNGYKTPSGASDSDTDDLLDARFDISKITDSVTRLSERTYSRESKTGDNMDECFRKFPSKVFFSEPVVKNSRTDTFGNRNIFKRHDIKDEKASAGTWEPLKGLSECLIDPKVIYKNNLEKAFSNQIMQEASTSNSSNCEKYAPVKTDSCENIITQKAPDVNKQKNSEKTITRKFW